MTKRKQTRITKSAKGQECQIRVDGVCNSDPETTVLCHLNGGGMGGKHYDMHGAYGCSSCHTWIDGGYSRHSDRLTRDLYHLEAVIRTQSILIDLGLIHE